MTPDVKIQQLRYFVLVADLRSFNAAAERVSRTQPAVSLAIRELEERLGERLFEKGRKVALTPYGRHCYAQARTLVEHYGRVVHDMSLRATRRSGRVAIACVPSFASQRLPAIVAGFVRRHPGLQLEIEDDTAGNVRRRVLDQRVDFGVGSLWKREAELDFYPLLRDEIGLICRRDHPLANRSDPPAWGDLSGHTLINNGTTRLLDGTAAREAITHADLFVSNIISLLAMLRAGIGVTTLPRLALAPDDPDLVFRPLREPRIHRCLGLITRSGQTLSPAADALRTCLLEGCRDRPTPA